MQHITRLIKAIVLGCAIAGLTQSALADTPKKAKAAKHAKQAKQDAGSAGDDKDVDVAHATVIDLHCALGDQVTLYREPDSNKNIAMRWKKRLVKLDPVETTTGAQRYESKKHGLVWIGIPAKGLLLDSRKGQQLANDCRTHEQIAAQSQPQAAPEPQIFMEARK